MNRRIICMALTVFLAPLFLAASPAQETEGIDRTSRVRTRVFEWHGMGRGFLGVEVTHLTPELRTHFGVPEDTGVMVSRLSDGGPAEAAGILVADIITAVDGAQVSDIGDLARAVRKKNEGDTVTVELYRDGALQSYPVTIEERERRVFDLAGGYRFIGRDADGDYDEHDFVYAGPGIHLDEDSRRAFEDAMGKLNERFQSDEWRERMERLGELDFTTIEDRMREVETRLKELEKALSQETEVRERTKL